MQGTSAVSQSSPASHLLTVGISASAIVTPTLALLRARRLSYQRRVNEMDRLVVAAVFHGGHSVASPGRPCWLLRTIPSLSLNDPLSARVAVVY